MTYAQAILILEAFGQVVPVEPAPKPADQIHDEDPERWDGMSRGEAR